MASNQTSIRTILNVTALAALALSILQAVRTGNAYWLLAPSAVLGGLAGSYFRAPRFGFLFFPILIIVCTLLFPHVLEWMNVRNLTAARSNSLWRTYEVAISGDELGSGLLWPYVEQYYALCRQYPRATFRCLVTAASCILLAALVRDLVRKGTAAEQCDQRRVAEL